MTLAFQYFQTGHPNCRRPAKLIVAGQIRLLADRGQVLQGIRRMFSCPPLQPPACRRSAPFWAAKAVLAGHDHAVSHDSGLSVRDE